MMLWPPLSSTRCRSCHSAPISLHSRMRSPPTRRLIALSLRRSLSTGAKVPLLLSPKEFKELPTTTTLPLDVSWHMPNSNRSPAAEFLTGPRIPGARRFDLDDVAELDIGKNPLSLVHMLPTKERFAEACGQSCLLCIPMRILWR